MSDNIGQEQARMLEQAKSGSGPIAPPSTQFVLALFMNAGVLKPLNEYFTQAEIDEPVPVRPRGHHRARTARVYAWW